MALAGVPPTPDSQYITLMSTASLASFPKNTSSNFTTRFDPPLELRGGDFQIALTDIFHPTKWVNITENDFSMSLYKQQKTRHFKPGANPIADEPYDPLDDPTDPTHLELDSEADAPMADAPSKLDSTSIPVFPPKPTTTMLAPPVLVRPKPTAPPLLKQPPLGDAPRDDDDYDDLADPLHIDYTVTSPNQDPIPTPSDIPLVFKKDSDKDPTLGGTVIHTTANPPPKPTSSRLDSSSIPTTPTKPITTVTTPPAKPTTSAKPAKPTTLVKPAKPTTLAKPAKSSKPVKRPTPAKAAQTSPPKKQKRDPKPTEEVEEEVEATPPPELINYRVQTTHTQKWAMPAGYYATIQQVLQNLNQSIRKTFRNKGNEEIFAVDLIKGRVRLKLKSGVTLRLSQKLADLLGLKSLVQKGPTFRLAEKPYYLKKHLGSLHVYLSVMQDRVVGDTMAPLIGMVPHVDNYPPGLHIANYNFLRPHYFPIKQKFIDSVTCNIRDSDGDLISFEQGQSTLTLHLVRATS